MLSQIEFILTETFLSLRRHPMMAFAATTCIAATLFIAGIMALSFLNARYVVDTLMEKVRFVVFFNPDVSREETRALYQRIKNLPGLMLLVPPLFRKKPPGKMKRPGIRKLQSA